MDVPKHDLMTYVTGEGRVAPRDWHGFYGHLRRLQSGRGEPPPVPLILAAAYEPDNVKHRRLLDQIEWAAAHGCFKEVDSWLRALSHGDWQYDESRRWMPSRSD